MKKIIYIIVAASLLTSSCNDWLDVAPKTELPAKEMFSKEDGFKDAITACYIKMGATELYGGHLTMNGIDYMAQYWDFETANSNDADKTVFRNFDYKAKTTETVFKNIYLGLYNVIVQANLVYENIKNSDVIFKDEKMKNIVEGEALAIRAFCHFDLLRIFGQMPSGGTKKVSLPYAEVVSPTADIPLYDYNRYIAKIEADLTAAEALMENDPLKQYSFKEFSSLWSDDDIDIKLEFDPYYMHRRFRLNYYALKALQARFYLYIGKTDEAYAAAKVIIDAKQRNGKPISILGGNQDLSAANYILPSEGLFALSHNEFTVDKDNPLYEFTMTLTKINNELFRGRSTASNNRLTMLWGKRTGTNMQEFPTLNKYKQRRDVSESTDVNGLLAYRQQIPLLRLSEVYLIAMESAPSLSETNTLYKEYMVARNEQVGDFSNMVEAKEEILNEYRREFIAEGQMFFAYKRVGAKKMMWKDDGEISENQYLVPTPITEFK